MRFDEAMHELAARVIVEANAEFLRQHASYEFESFAYSGEQVTDGGNTFRVTVEFEPRARSAAQLAASKN